MDRKALIVLTLSFVLLIFWFPLVNSIWPPRRVPVDTNEVRRAAASTNETTVAEAETEEAEAQASVPKPVVSPEPAGPAPAPEGPEQTMQLENDRLQATLTSHGGGLKGIRLKRYQRVPNRDGENQEGATELVVLNEHAPRSILSLWDTPGLQGDGIFQLAESQAGLTATKDLGNGIRLVNEFQPGTNYLIFATTRIENRGTNSIRIPEVTRIVGTATPINTNDQPLFNGVFWYNGEESVEVGQSWFANRFLGCFPGQPRTRYEGGTNVVWTAVHNQFFCVITQPAVPAWQVMVQAIDLPVVDRRGRAFQGYQAGVAYPGQVLEPGKAIQHRYEIYAGPKEYKRLSQLGSERELVMDFGGFFGFFSKALLLSMNGLHAIGISYGWSIILITIIIKMLFWPLTNASTKSMKRMSQLQPQMKQIQEKYKEDPQKMNRELMKFMKENKVSPLGGCLPMLLQMPVFIGFFFMIKSAIELRGAEFLWAWDLSQPDTLFHLPGLGFPVNPMPILMGVTMLYQARMTPMAPGVDPVQGKIMKYMPLIFVVFLYNFSSGLTLYWTVSNLLTIIQTKITRTAEQKKQDPRPAKNTGAPKPVFSGKKKRRRKP